MATDKKTEVYVAETGSSTFAVQIAMGDHILIGDETEEAGGKNLGPTPYEVLTAALGECTAMTVRWYAKQKNWPLDKVEVRLSHEKVKQEGQPGKVDVFTKFVTLTGPLLDESQRAKLFEVSAKCPVQRTLEAAPQIRSEYA